MKGEGMKYDEGIKGRPKERKFNLRLKTVKLGMIEGIGESGGGR
jgi:hypothetical protein